MGLFEQISEDIRTAMKAQEKKKLEALRAIKAAFLLEKTKGEGHNELTDEIAMKLIAKLVKQRRESATIYQAQNRPDLYEIEVFEAEVLEKYLPSQLSDDELKAALLKIMAEVGATAPSHIGKVMGVASKSLSGQADGKRISAMAKELLAS